MVQSQIDRLELYNFKSYAGRVTVGPFRDFTCIVGPNGAGKSNIMDALSFVLGAATTVTTSTMRGRRLTDFIHRKGGCQECAVTLVLRHAATTGQDRTNESGKTDVATSSRETAFTRRVNATGAVAVYVNQTAVPEEAFAAALGRLGIGTRTGHFLVFQHEVERVAQMRGRGLTELLEQVSGSAALKSEYDTAKAALQRANEALSNASVEKRGAAVAANQTRLARQEAERYEQLRQRHSLERRQIALAELYCIEQELQRQRGELDKFHERLAELQKGIASEAAIQEMKRRYAERHRAYLDTLRSHRKISEEVREANNTRDWLQATLAHMTRKYELQKAELAQLQRADTTRAAEVRRLREQRERQASLLQRFDADCAREDAARTTLESVLSPEQLVEYRQLRKEADCATVTLRQQASTVRRQRESTQEALKQCELAQESQRLQRAALEQSREQMTRHRDDLTRRIAELQEAATGLERQIATAQQNAAQQARRAETRTAELAKLQEQLHELRFVKDSDQQQSRLMETMQALRSLFPGLRGRLVDLCSIPNDRYRNAVTVALGKHLEAIVVETTEVALSCVRHLKAQRLPPMTFLPLDALQGKAVDDRLRTLGGTCRPLVDVVRYEPFLEPAVRFALGQTLVCDTISEAKEVAYGRGDGERFRVVTVDGTLLLKNGSVQGGLAAIQTRARKWDEKRYDDLRAARDALLSEAGSEVETARAQIALRDMAARLTFTQNRLQVLRVELAAQEDKLAGVEAELQRQSETTAQLSARAAAYQDELASADTEQLRLSRQIAQVEGGVFAAFQERVKVPNLLQLEGQAAAQTKARAERRQELQLLIHRLDSLIETETGRIGGQTAAEAREMCTKLEQDRAKCEHDLAAQRTTLAELETRLNAHKETLAATRTELTALEHDIHETARSAETQLARLAHARKGATGLQAACDTLRLQRQTVVRRCQIEGIELPLVVLKGRRARNEEGEDGGDATHYGDAAHRLLRSEPFKIALGIDQDASPTTTTSSSSSSSASTRQTAADQEQTVCIDFHDLSEVGRQAAADRAGLQAYRQRAEALVTSLEAEMHALAPNLRMASHYRASEDRLGASATLLETVRERARQAQAAFTSVKERRTRLFMATYEKIAASVDQMYRDLTLNTRGEGVHGSAYLSLEDSEEPYLGATNYHATPPLKRFMPMELLSGGERTMAALALLFAIHAISPTPFFVLDEVDAALDAGNVEKLAYYLRKNCTRCQFVVVSLKDQLYHMADLLVGVLKDKERQSSRIITMDLRGYAY